MEAEGSFKTLILTYQTALRHIPEDTNLHGHPRENTKERNFDEFWGKYFSFLTKFTDPGDMYLQ
jgi:hypothetical protein